MGAGNSEKKPVRVAIFGRPYTLIASGDPHETEELARMVDGLMEGISGKTGSDDPARVAVLACLHLADRLHVLQQELESLRERVDRKSREFSILLDQAIEGHKS